MREIVITISDKNRIDVREGDKYCDGLSWDEMLGQIAAMTLPKERIEKVKGLYPMRTAEEWEQQRKALMERIEQSEVNSIFGD